jgi:hypothetical protein
MTVLLNAAHATVPYSPLPSKTSDTFVGDAVPVQTDEGFELGATPAKAPSPPDGIVIVAELVQTAPVQLPG